MRAGAPQDNHVILPLESSKFFPALFTTTAQQAAVLGSLKIFSLIYTCHNDFTLFKLIIIVAVLHNK